MIRILHVFHNMANGGIEHFVMDYYRHIDRTQIQFDFLVSDEKKGYFDDEIESLGGKVYHAYPLKKNPLRNYNDIARIVRQNQYSIVHRHTGSAFGYYDLRAAKKGGAKHLILHSHNPQVGRPLLHKLSAYILKIECKKLACSEEAGKFLFGSNAKFRVINNAIECDRYKFSDILREQVRQELNLANCFVVGHVGRFEEQKNHRKLFEIFEQIHAKKSNSVLVCVGEGSLMNQCKEYAKKLGIFENIRFLGTRDDVERILQAFDVFCFPSRYEGFSITQIEAQVNGLHCFTSRDVVPEKSNITGNVTFLPLEEDATTWANEVLKVAAKRDLTAIDKVKKAGYDIDEAAKSLCLYYQVLL